MNKLAYFGDAIALRARRQRVQICDDEKAFVGILKAQAVFQRTYVVPEVQLTCGPVSSENSFSIFAHDGGRISGTLRTVNASVQLHR
jgi:hypothetical protein